MEYISTAQGSLDIEVSGNDVAVFVYNMCNEEDDLEVDHEIRRYATATAMPNKEIGEILQGYGVLL